MYDLKHMGAVITGTVATIVGISDEHLSVLLSIGAIILGYAWMEARFRSIVKDAFEAHNAVESERYKAIENRFDNIIKHVPKRRSDTFNEG